MGRRKLEGIRPDEPGYYKYLKKRRRERDERIRLAHLMDGAKPRMVYIHQIGWREI